MPPALRADQVGALLRPEKLLEARAPNQGAQLDRDGLTRAEDEAIDFGPTSPNSHRPR